MQLGTTANPFLGRLLQVAQTKKPRHSNARDRLPFSALFILFIKKMRGNSMEMRPKMKCNMQHSVITCTCCVSTKMPYSGPTCFVQSLDTLAQSLGTWRNRVSHRHASRRESVRPCGCWRWIHLIFEPINFALQFLYPVFKVFNLRSIQQVLSFRFPKLVTFFMKRGRQSG